MSRYEGFIPYVDSYDTSFLMDCDYDDGDPLDFDDESLDELDDESWHDGYGYDPDLEDEWDEDFAVS